MAKWSDGYNDEIKDSIWKNKISAKKDRVIRSRSPAKDDRNSFSKLINKSQNILARKSNTVGKIHSPMVPKNGKDWIDKDISKSGDKDSN